MTYTVELKAFGQQLATRELASRIRTDILARTAHANARTPILFDMDGVQTLSSGFAHELFGGLLKFFGPDFPKLVSFRFGNNPNKDFLRMMINRGLAAVEPEDKSGPKSPARSTG